MERIERNKYWIDLAKKCGLFKDGYDKKDIYSSSDSIIINWIDELDKSSLTDSKFIEEVVPAFSRWCKNGVDTTGVGKFYNSIRLMELKEQAINSFSVSCIMNTMTTRGMSDVSMNNSQTGYDAISNYFEVDEFLDNLIRFNRLGVHYFILGDCYDELVELYNRGDKIDLYTGLFFSDMDYRKNKTQRMTYWLDREHFIAQYGYAPYTASEVKLLNELDSFDGKGVAGYNSPLADELRRELDKIAKRHDGALKRENEIIANKMKGSKFKTGKEVTVYYTTYSNGKIKYEKVQGILLSCYEWGISLEVNGEIKAYLNDDDTLITRVTSSHGGVIYECSRSGKEEFSQMHANFLNKNSAKKGGALEATRKKLVANVSKQKKSGDKLTVSYYTFDLGGNLKTETFNGSLILADAGKFLLVAEDGQNKRFENNDDMLILSIYSSQKTGDYWSGNKPFYQCPDRVKKDWAESSKTKRRLKKVEEVNVVDKYYKKFGTLAGLAYLRNNVLEFIEVIDPRRFPIDNLFALCFENIGYNKKSPESSLKAIWCAYNMIASKKVDYLSKYLIYNCGGELNNVLTNDVIEAVNRICLYVHGNRLEEELPPEPSGLGSNSSLGMDNSPKNDNTFVFSTDKSNTNDALFTILYDELLKLLPKDLLEQLTGDQIADIIMGLVDELSVDERETLLEGRATELLKRLLERFKNRMIELLAQGNTMGKGVKK